MTWQTCEALVPVLIGVVIDRAVRPSDGAAMGLWIAVLAAVFLVLTWSGRWGGRLEARAVQLAAHDARMRIATAVLDPRAAPDPAGRTGTVLFIASEDTYRAGQVNTVLPVAAGAVTSLSVAAVALLNISLPLGLVVVLGVPPLLFAVHLLGVPLERRSGTEQADAAAATNIATDVLSGLRVLKGIGGEAPALGRYRAASRRSLTATLRAATAESILAGVTTMLTMSFLAVVALVGGRFAAEGRITVGDLVAAVGLAQFLIGPFTQLGYVGALWAKARASATRVADTLTTHRAVESTSPAVASSGRVGLTVRTEDVALHLGVRETLGVAGDPGRSTALVELLAQGWHRGEAVLLDGVPLAALDPATVSARLIVNTHDAHLFRLTVRDNLTTTVGSADRIDAALAAADADQVVDALPDGVHTVLGERGRSLSGGQRQRLALARALAADPPILVLHDPTTAVDSATEAHIAARLADLRSDRSTVIVTTSPALLARCDRVVFLDGAGGQTEGSHAELAATEPGYRRMVLA